MRKHFLVQYDLWEHRAIIPGDVRSDAKQRRKYLATYCKEHVTPKLAEADRSCLEQLAGLNSEGLIPYSELVPLRHPWKPSERWLEWPPSMWQMHGIWAVARIIGGTPILSIASGDFITLFPSCPFCGARVISLLHIVAVCVGTADLRKSMPLRNNASPMDILREALAIRNLTHFDVQERIVLVASAVSRLAQALELSTLCQNYMIMFMHPPPLAVPPLCCLSALPGPSRQEPHQGFSGSQ